MQISELLLGQIKQSERIRAKQVKRKKGHPRPVPHSRADCNSHEIAGTITTKELGKGKISIWKCKTTTQK
jgi:hypothetical protein